MGEAFESKKTDLAHHKNINLTYNPNWGIVHFILVQGMKDLDAVENQRIFRDIVAKEKISFPLFLNINQP